MGDTDNYDVIDLETGLPKKIVADNFPLIDFHLGDKVLSLKTVDTNGITWVSRMRTHIYYLGNRGVASDGIIVSKANRTLDICVQPGGMTDAMILKPFVNAVGINLIIKEYGK